MRVTLLNHRYYPFRGGSEIYVQKLAEWFAERKCAVRIVTTDALDLEYFWDRRLRSIDAPSHETIAGVDVERLPVTHPIGSSVVFQGSRRAMGEASRLLSSRPPYERIAKSLPRIEGVERALSRGPAPDIIIGTNLGLEGLAVRGQEVAARVGASFILLPFAHLGAADDQVAHRFVSMPHQRALVKGSDLVIALTRLEAAALERLGAHPGRVIVAGAGVEPNAIDGKEGPIECPVRTCRTFTIISIGALAFDKGTADLIAASMLLHDRGIHHRLILIGPELTSFSAWRRNSAIDECDWIELRGTVEDEEKHHLLRESDVLVLASRTESFGIVYLEAWLHGLPVVGADAGAVSEVVSDGVDGLLVPFGEPEAIAAALGSLHANRSWAASLGKAGREKVQREHLWSHVHRRIEEGIERVLGNVVA